MSLEKLIQHCKKGDRKAQEQLYRKYASVLFGLCLKYSRNKTEAEDNLHDSFLTIFDKIEQFKFKGSFEGWIKRITVNTVLQKYRKEQYLNLVTDNLEEEQDVDYEYPDIQLSTLLQYVQELPAKYRLTFNLYVLDGYTHKQISELLGTSQGTSKSNLVQSKKDLAGEIKKRTYQHCLIQWA